MTNFTKFYSPKDFLLNQEYASNECWRELQSKMLDVHWEIENMVSEEKNAMKERNEERKKTIIIEADRKAFHEKELPKNIVEGLKRFQF